MWKLGIKPDKDDASLRERFELASECMFLVDDEGRIVEANEAAANAFGWPAEMFSPMSIDWFVIDVVEPESLDVNSVRDLLRSDTKPGQDSSVVIGKSIDGMKFRANLQVEPARGSLRENSAIRYIVSIGEALSYQSFTAVTSNALA